MVAARATLEAELTRPGLDADARLAVLQALLDVCLAGEDERCVAERAADYANTAEPLAKAHAEQRLELARRAGYYLDYALYLRGSPEIDRHLLDHPLWSADHTGDVTLYLRRQRLAAKVLIATSDWRGADWRIDKALSLIATLKTPEEAGPIVAQSLVELTEDLLDIGETERAYGIFLATHEALSAQLAGSAVERARAHLLEARLKTAVGDQAGALAAAMAATKAYANLELPPKTQAAWLSEALSLQASICLLRKDLACVQAALAQHPLASLYSKPGRHPQTAAEVDYLTLRAMAADLSGQPDPQVAAALRPPLDFSTISADRALEVERRIGAALASPPGGARDAGLQAAAASLHELAASRPAGAFGSWARPTPLDQSLIALALGQTRPATAVSDETAFALHQLAGRQGADSDAFALALLGEARDEPQRRAAHQALRLKARRDRMERDALGRIAARMTSATPAGARPQPDFRARGYLRDFAFAIRAADESLRATGVATSGAGLTTLAELQAVLVPGEAALSIAPTPDGLAYLCVRRDRVWREVRPADLQGAKLDVRLLQAALTAGHPPSEALDAQYPVAAAMRLYDLYLRPFEGCLSPQDQILWLPNAALTQIPLAALLTAAPPKLGRGYDLGQAEFVVKRRAIAYPGSPAMLVAVRRRPPRSAPDFDLLGLGDPVLQGAGAPAGVSGLPPLPDTRAELLESAKGFRSVRLLTGTEATERGFRTQLVGSYRFLSFATHGLIREDLKGLTEPALALTPGEGREGVDDGLLTASEIADLNLSAAFVVLSACNTANYDLSQITVELPALASAFAVAGVPATLATLWPVDSQSSRRIAVAVFGAVRDGRGPAQALAEAQRAFLAAPPTRAHLHPRFWAPFLVMGDGGASTPIAPRTGRVTASLVLTHGGGEATRVVKQGEDLFANFNGTETARATRGSAVVRLAPSGTPAWRRVSDSMGLADALTPLPAGMLAGGHVTQADGRFAPHLQLIDAAGRLGRTWTGQTAAGYDGFVAAVAELGAGQAAVAVAELNLRGQAPGAARLKVYRADAALRLRLMFETGPPAGGELDAATLTLWGDALLVTYTQRAPPRRLPENQAVDDFDQPVCRAQPRTFVELRDAATGSLLGSAVLDTSVITAAVLQGDRMLIGGALRDRCEAEARALIAALGRDLSFRPVYADPALGGSEVRALADLGGGRTLVAAQKESVVDFHERTGTLDAYNMSDLQMRLSGMLLTLSPNGSAGPPRMLDSGQNVFLNAADASRPDDLLLAGAIGGEAAVIRLSAAP